MSDPAHFLLSHFDRLAEAPGGIAKLRALVLHLAVQGKLGTQNPKDEPATKLVERMTKARKELAKAPKLSALPEELPSELPASWMWQPLCALLREPSQNGYSQSADENPDGVPLLRISAGTSRVDGDVEEADFKRTTLDAATKAKFALQSGDLLAVRFNGNLHFTGKVTIYRAKLGMIQIFPDKLIRLRVWNEFVVAEYLRLAMSAPVIRTAIESFCATSVGNMGISASDLVTVPIPLPPLAEQRRIVAKVEELMGLCDTLEAAQREREAVRTRLRTSALHRLASSDSDSKSATFVLQYFSRLTTAPEDLTPFRDLVSWMAVEGELSTDGTENWSTDRFENVVELQGGVTKGRNLVGEKTVELPYLRVANVQRGHLELDVMKVIEIRERESDKYALRAGDLVITEGGDWDKVGRTAVWREEIKPCIHQNHIFRARPDPKRLWPEWAMLALNSRKGRDYFADASKQTTNLASINMSQLRRFPIPLPPFAEQRRIVAKVDELMAVLDALEAALTTARTTSENLLAATIAKLHAA